MRMEHAHLDKLWADFSIETDDIKAKTRFNKFRKSLLKHIKLEDDVLSPILSKRLFIEKETGPSAVSYHDHENIIKLLYKLNVAFNSNDEKLIEYTKTHFKHALEKHLNREDEMNYPLFDTFISQQDWKEILSKRISV